MPDPTIRAALEQLEQAIMSAVEGECDGLAITRQQARAIGAYGVRAFLGALPDGVIWRDGPIGRPQPDGGLHALATAVEEAARDE